MRNASASAGAWASSSDAYGPPVRSCPTVAPCTRRPSSSALSAADSESSFASDGETEPYGEAPCGEARITEFSCFVFT